MALKRWESTQKLLEADVHIYNFILLQLINNIVNIKMYKSFTNLKIYTVRAFLEISLNVSLEFKLYIES